VFGGWSSSNAGEDRQVGVVLATVTPAAARADLVFDGGDIVEGALFSIPDRYVGPAQGLVIFVPPDLVREIDAAHLVAYDAQDAQLADEPMSMTEPGGPTPEIDAVWDRLRNAREELARYGAKQAFDDLRIVATIDSPIDYILDPGGLPDPGTVAVRDVTDHRLVLVARATTGETYCIGIEIDAGGGGNYRYGMQNARTYEDCSDGWGL
jgi:hypothetical protein